MEKNFLKELIEGNGFIKHNNYKVEDIEDERVTMSGEIKEESINPHGIAHGGFVFGLADTTMGVLASLAGQRVVTVDSTINYLKPCKGKKITCVATPIKVGKTLGVYQANIYNDDGELSVTVTGTYIFLTKDINK